MEMPESPLSIMKVASIQMHEMYTDFVEAGFTPEQAFELLKLVFRWQLSTIA